MFIYVIYIALQTFNEFLFFDIISSFFEFLAESKCEDQSCQYILRRYSRSPLNATNRCVFTYAVCAYTLYMYREIRTSNIFRDMTAIGTDEILTFTMSARHSPEYSDYRRSEQQETLVAPPLDLSFRKATRMSELTEKRYTQIIRTGKAPTRTLDDRYVTSTLWLSNNLLSSMEGLQSLVDMVLDKPEYLSWLDLSFNEISEIGEDIEKFANLKILYLHGNRISNIVDTLRLRKLQSLRSLTLHGNPIEDTPCYRGYIVHILPQLLVLDFSPIIAAEKKKPLPTGFSKMIQSGIRI